ncbi:MAG: RnfABCDGE type electron transport complex subunit G [Desulfobacterales bacterium]|nr:RnfABCDGE type electron transport complex subunit G [Desulfobacterales bacterium]
MKDMIKMVVVLTVLSAVSGWMLAGLNGYTKDRIKLQELTFVKGPALKTILSGAENDPISDNFDIEDGETIKTIFVGKFDGKPSAVAFESYGKGFGGDVGVMISIDTNNDTIIGAGVTTHAETPGMGAKAKDDPTFVNSLKGLPIGELKVTQDGGKINAISGATITSRAVCGAVTDASSTYNRLKSQINEKLKNY